MREVICVEFPSPENIPFPRWGLQSNVLYVRRQAIACKMNVEIMLGLRRPAMIMQSEKVLPGRALAESKNDQFIIVERQNWNASVSGVGCRGGQALSSAATYSLPRWCHL